MARKIDHKLRCPGLGITYTRKRILSLSERTELFASDLVKGS